MSKENNNPFEIIDEDKIGGAIERANKKMGDMAVSLRATVRWIVNALALFAIILLRLVEANWELTSIWKTITINALLLSLINFVVYINSGDMGEAQGRKSAEYLVPLKSYEELKARITEKGLRGKLNDWCTQWSKTELENARKQLFESCAISYDDYIKKSYVQMGKSKLLSLGLSHQVVKIILQANNMKPIELSPSMLIDNNQKSKRSKRALGKQPQAKRITNDFVKIVFIFLSLAFSCSIVFSVYAKIDLASIAGAILAVLLLCYNVISGYMGRYNIIVINAVEYIKDRTQYLEEFEKWCENAY